MLMRLCQTLIRRRVWCTDIITCESTSNTSGMGMACIHFLSLTMHPLSAILLIHIYISDINLSSVYGNEI